MTIGGKKDFKTRSKLVRARAADGFRSTVHNSQVDIAQRTRSVVSKNRDYCPASPMLDACFAEVSRALLGQNSEFSHFEPRFRDVAKMKSAEARVLQASRGAASRVLQHS
jgi:hypothetical protein